MVVKSQELESDHLQIQILSPMLMTKWPWDNLMWLYLEGPSPGSWHMVGDQQMRAVIIHFARFPLSSSTDIILFDITTLKNTIPFSGVGTEAQISCVICPGLSYCWVVQCWFE